MKKTEEVKCANYICRFCLYFRYDYEYGEQRLGQCENNIEVMHQRIMLGHCDEFYIAEDFGCRFFKKI